MSPTPRYGRRRRRIVAEFILWCLVVITVEAVPSAAAAEAVGNAYTALTAGFRQGDFGGSVNNELYSLTPEIGYVTDSYDVSASMPFQRLDVSGGGVSSSQSGIGDARLRGGRYLWRDGQELTSLYGALTVKLATGDENKGLGTGGTDIGASLTASRRAGDYTFTALAGYTQVGEPSGVTYDNVLSYGVGAARRFTRSSVFASLQGQTSAIPGGTAPLEFDAGFFRILSLDYVITVNGFVGLSHGSPDGGMEIGIVRWYR